MEQTDHEPNAKDKEEKSVKRDSWMHPSTLDVQYISGKRDKGPESAFVQASLPDVNALKDLREGSQELHNSNRDAFKQNEARDDSSADNGTEIDMTSAARSHDIRLKEDQTNRENNSPGQEYIRDFGQSQGLDQSALNKLKARMLRAKMTKAADAGQLEAEYEREMAKVSETHNREIVLNKMESHMLAGERNGEVKRKDNKRAQERGLVEENEDMSINDMIRQEKRTKGQSGGHGKLFAESISKDSKFTVRGDTVFLISPLLMALRTI